MEGLAGQGRSIEDAHSEGGESFKAIRPEDMQRCV